jgi:hypothetical protein
MCLLQDNSVEQRNFLPGKMLAEKRKRSGTTHATEQLVELPVDGLHPDLVKK